MFIITSLLNWVKRQIRDQFGFSKAETNGVLVLLIILLCLLATPPILSRYYNNKTYLDTNAADIALLDSTLALLESQRINNKTFCKQQDTTTKPHYKKQATILKNIKPFDINTTDTQQLQSLPGIGNKRATRIIKYRDKLGGFMQKEQYQAIYGLDSLSIYSMSQYTYIATNFQPKKININQASFKILVAHPYLSYEKVQLIVNYRTKKGRFDRIENLLELNILEKDVFEKLKSYLTV